MKKFNVSIAEISKVIFALSALRSFLNRENKRQVPLLTADRQEALTVIIENAIREVALKVGGEVAAAVDGVVEVTLKEGSDAIRGVFEQACALWALWLVNVGYDAKAARDYQEQVETAIALIKNSISRVKRLATIIPKWF